MQTGCARRLCRADWVCQAGPSESSPRLFSTRALGPIVARFSSLGIDFLQGLMFSLQGGVQRAPLTAVDPSYTWKMRHVEPLGAFVLASLAAGSWLSVPL